MPNKVLIAGPQVLVVLRHDPGSSDPVDVAYVATPGMLGLAEDDDTLIDQAEAWAIDREIQFIRQEAAEGEDGPEKTASMQQAEQLTRANFTKRTDLWFEPVLMPLIVEELR